MLFYRETGNVSILLLRGTTEDGENRRCPEEGEVCRREDSVQEGGTVLVDRIPHSIYSHAITDGPPASWA